MEHLLTALTRAIEGAPAVALGASFVWGVLSVVLSPCHLASIPLIVGFINGQGKMTARRAFGLSSLFAMGILATIALVGVVTNYAGRMWGDLGPYPNYIVGGILLLVGLHLLGVIPMPFSGPGSVKMKRKGMLASFIMGLVFGVALGPCTFGFMFSVLGVTFEVAKSSLTYATALLLAFGIGHCSVIAFAGTSAGAVQRYLDWNESSRGAATLRKICGILVIAGGAYLIWRVLCPSPGG